MCWGPYQTFKELVTRDKRVSEANPMFATIRQPGIGEYLAPSNPLDFHGVGRIRPLPAPRLGEHTNQILEEILGLTSAEIGRLRESKVVQ